MSDTQNQAGNTRGAVILIGLGVALFLVGAVIGYCRGAFTDGGSTERGMDWAIKTGLLLLAMSAMLGTLGGIVLNTLPLPVFLGWALLMGLGFAIMNGGGAAWGLNDGEVWPTTLRGFLEGALIGAIAGPLIQRSQQKSPKKTAVGQDA